MCEKKTKILQKSAELEAVCDGRHNIRHPIWQYTPCSAKKVPGIHLGPLAAEILV
jgi:hypothetical protein